MTPNQISQEVLLRQVPDTLHIGGDLELDQAFSIGLTTESSYT